MKRNRILALALGLVMTVGLLSGCQKAPADASSSASQSGASSSPAVSQPDASTSDDIEAVTSANVMVLAGPTGVGAAKMMEDNGIDDNPGSRTWNFTLAADNSEVMPAINTGAVDIAATATNVASTIYNKTEGKVTMLAINTEGVLYILEKGETVSSLADLKGKTLYCPATAKGANPEYILNYLLTENGVDPTTDLTIEWLTPQEITAKMASSDSGVCMLPVPAATALLLKDQGVREALDLSAEWEKIVETPLVQGCIVVRTEFLEQNPDVVDAFLIEYQQSIAYMNDEANLDEAAELVAKHGITANAQIAKMAIPQCNLTFLTGAEMQQSVQDYYEILFQANPAAIGGAMPYDDFYYNP